MQLKKLECQSSSQVQALQDQLCCTQQAEKVEREEKQRLQAHLKETSKEATHVQRISAEKNVLLIQTQSEAAKLRHEKLEGQARIDALSVSMDNMRIDAQNAILRAASKEDEIQKEKNNLSFIEAELSAKNGQLSAIEAARVQLQDRFLAISSERDGLKGQNCDLKNELSELQSQKRACEAMKTQLRKDLDEQQQKCQDLVQELLSKTSLLERKSIELSKFAAKMQVTQDRLEKAQLELHDARLQISNAQV